MTKIKTDKAIVVEGRDDVDAVGKAVDALIIPTHGFGITAETWSLLEKAYKEKGLIILTDPDFSGEEIRRKLTARFPDSIQAYISQEDATLGDDIGVENAGPRVIADAVKIALDNAYARDQRTQVADIRDEVTMSVMTELGLTGCDGAGELRQAVCSRLGIGHGNAKAVIKKLAYWGIGIKELEQTIEEIRQKSQEL